jgi:IS5 family transposase
MDQGGDMANTPQYHNTGIGAFWGSYLFEMVVPQDHFLRALKELFGWDELAARLIRLYDGKGLVGRPPYSPVLMFQMLFLSYLYDLSARDTERFVNENIPARYFLDLALDQSAPDHSTMSLFKDRLMSEGNWDELQRIFDGLLQQARDQGLRLGCIQVVDSVHTQTDVNAEKDKKRQEQGQAPRDPEARVVHKGEHEVVEPDGQTVTKEIRYRGYKTHVSMEAETRIVTSLVPDWGNSADNKAFPELLAHDRSLDLPTHTYGGDKAYDDTDLFERIIRLGLHVGITLRRNRTTKKDPNKQRWLDLKETPHYQVATALRSRVEQPFGQAKDKHGFERCRYLGRLNYGVQAFLTFTAINAKRMVKLLVGITFRELAKGRRKEVFQPVYASRPWA